MEATTRVHRPLGFLLFMLMVMPAFCPASAAAADFLVSSEVDAVDADPGDGVCDIGTGDCTLRAAVMEANAFPGADTVLLPAGDYALTIPPDDHLPPPLLYDWAGDLDVLEDLVIEGLDRDPATTVIRGDAIAVQLLDAAPAVSLDVRHITLTEGSYLATEGDGASAIDMVGGTLSLLNCVVSYGSGSSFSAGVAAIDTAVSITDSLFTDNYSVSGVGGLRVTNGSLVISNSRFVRNTGENGGISAPGSALISDSEFIGSAHISGAWAVDLSGARCDRCLFQNNSGGWNGGALKIGECHTCSIIDNRGGTDFLVDVGLLVDSTVARNTTSQTGQYGAQSMSLGVVRNSTVSGNATNRISIGTAEFSTIVDNVTESGTSVFLAGATTDSSVVAGNTQDCAPGVLSQGFNVIGNADDCPTTPIASDVAGNLASPLDPRLGPLGSKGGPTETHSLLAGSPAIDLVPQADCTFDDDLDPGTLEVPLVSDQRGFSRPRGPGCDAGAYERKPERSCGLGAELALVLPALAWVRRRGQGTGR